MLDVVILRTLNKINDWLFYKTMTILSTPLGFILYGVANTYVLIKLISYL